MLAHAVMHESLGIFYDAHNWKIAFKLVYEDTFTLKCLSIGTPKAINFPCFLGVPAFKHIVMRL